MNKVRPRITESEYELIKIHRIETGVENVLVIPDPHEPFCKDGFMEFCYAMYLKWKCTRVVFTGDIIDQHYSSFHSSCPDGFGAGQELDRAIAKIAKWYELFPVATICIGNHDAIVSRKAFDAGISSRWIRDYTEVLKTPNWTFVDNITINGVLYCHGMGAAAEVRCKDEFVSVCQGHLHTKSYYRTFVSEVGFHFAMQLGCGIDRRSYAFAYAKDSKKPQINCGVVLDNGRSGVIEHMLM